MKRSLAMTLTALAFTALLSFSYAAGNAEAQTVINGNLTGTIVSGVALLPNSGTSATLVTAPPSGRGFFILTQCVSSFSGANTGVVGTTVGPIPCNTDGGLGLQLTPGFAMPADEVLTCANNFGCPPGNCVVRCLITGIVSRR